MLLTLCEVSAQHIVWQRTLGGSGWDELRKIGPTVDGGFFVAGFSASPLSDDKTEGNLGYLDYWVLKLDSTGAIQWQNTIGGSGEDRAMDFYQTMDGGFIIAGYSDSPVSGDKSENSRGGLDYWIVKLSDIGVIQWQKTIGGSGDDELYQVVQTLDKGYILAGVSMSPVSGDKTEDSLGRGDYWIVKTDSVGNLLWQNTIGGAGYENLRCLLQTSDNNFVIGGWSTSGAGFDKTEPRMGKSDLWILKLDTVGQIIWQNSIGGSEEDEIFGILEKDGQFWLAASSTSMAGYDKSEDSKGDADFWIVKLDTSGIVLWNKTYGGSAGDFPKDLTITKDGNIMIGGFTVSDRSEDKSEDCFGNKDNWIIVVDSVGNLLSELSIGGQERDYLYSTQRTGAGDIIVGGFSKSMRSGAKTNDSPSDDYWIYLVSDRVNTLKGTLWLDANADLTIDSSEIRLANYVLSTSGKQVVTLTNKEGAFSLVIPDTGFLSAGFTDIPYYSSTPLLIQEYFTGFNNIDSLNNISAGPLTSQHDLRIKLTRVSGCSVGEKLVYAIGVENNGTDTIQPIIQLYSDSLLHFSVASLTPDIVSADSISWQLGALLPLSYKTIYVAFLPDTTLLTGDSVSAWVTVITSGNELTPDDNQDHLQLVLMDKYETKQFYSVFDTVPNIGSPNFTGIEYVYYFMHSDTSTVNRLLLNQQVSELMNPSSFEILTAGDSLQAIYRNDSRLLTFEFDNLALSDTATNITNSIVYVRYKMYPASTITNGDHIEAFGYLYINSGEPLSTDTILIHIGGVNGIFDATTPGSILVFPNPVNDILNIKLPNVHGTFNVLLGDLAGRILMNESVVSENDVITVPVAKLSAGLYFIAIEINGVRFVSRFIRAAGKN